VSSSVSRRSLLRGGAALLAAAPAGISALLARSAQAGRPRAADSPIANPYGTPVPTLDQTTGLPLLNLPPDFTYRSISWTGDLMTDGSPTPERFDGMAVVQVLPGRAGDLVLIRNHENTFGPVIGGRANAPVYDPVAIGRDGISGGTTTMIFRRGQLVSTAPSLGGTVANCAGGPTPWGSWLTCEETIADGTYLGGLYHGFVFEVPAPSLGPASAAPILDMGLMKHEAAAVDPASGIVYETEDNDPDSGFYRYLPNDRAARVGALEAGGRLEMLRVVGADGADLDQPETGQTFAVDWVPIDDPSALPEAAQGSFLYFGPSMPYTEGRDRGGARFPASRRLLVPGRLDLVRGHEWRRRRHGVVWR
jgi:secreted PhoX family phosphatase